MTKKILAVILGFCLILSIYPVSAQSTPLVTVTINGGMTNLAWCQGLYIEFSQPVLESINNASINNVEDQITDYMIINGYDATKVNTLGATNGSHPISMHYIANANIFWTWIAFGAAGELDPTMENTIIFKKELPLVGGKTLGRNLKLTYNPNTSLWVTTVVSDADIADTCIPVRIYAPSGQGITDYGWCSGIDFKFFNRVSDIAPNVGNLATNVEGNYWSYVTVNNQSAVDIYNYPSVNKQVQIHYDTVENALITYLGNDATSRLYSDQQNVIIFNKDFPLANGTKLGKTIIFTYNPATQIWRQTNQNPQINISPLSNLGWCQGMDITFSDSVLNSVNNDPIYNIQSQMTDYMIVNGYKATEVNALGATNGNNPITMHYYPDTKRFWTWIAFGSAGEMDITVENTIIFTKNLPLANGKTLGVNIKETYNPATGTWTSSVVKDIDMPALCIPMKITAPTGLGMTDYGWTSSINIKSLNKILDVAPTEGYVDLSVNVQGYFWNYVTVNNESAVNIVNYPSVNPQFIMHYNTVTYELDTYLGNDAPSRLHIDQQNTIILNKDFPLAYGMTLGQTITFTYNPATGIWRQTVDYVGLSLNNYNILYSNIITKVSPNTTISSFINSLQLANDENVSVTSAIQDGTSVGTGSIVDITSKGITTEYTVSIFGDVNGDGIIDLDDLVAIRNNILDAEQLKGIYKTAGDLYGEGNITLNDLVGVMAYISESGNINQ